MRPYYTDPYTVSFQSEVTQTIQVEGRFCVTLERSYFYPTSGGQEHDKGYINGIDVVDVVEENGKVVHILSGPIDTGEAHCIIDRQRRFGNMQQHTGQHILSAAFENLFEIQTVSSRLGDDLGTIDLSRQPSDQEIAEAVSLSNQIIQEDRQVVVHFADDSTIGNFKLRKPPKIIGTGPEGREAVRIVEVKDFDFSPCGGTHCTHASEVGVVLTAGVEKVRGSRARISFACGNRGVEHYFKIHRSASESARALSAPIDALPVAIERLIAQNQENENRITRLTEKVLVDVCNKVGGQISASNGFLNVFDLSLEVGTAEELRHVASCLARKTNSAFAIIRGDGLLCQMNVNLPYGNADMKLARLRADLQVKGGGRNGFFSLTFDLDKLDRVIGILTGDAVNG